MRKPLRALILAEDFTNISLIEDALDSAYSLDYSTPTTLDDFMSRLEKQSLDIVFTDYCMFGFSALEVLKLVKMYKKDIPVIIVSGTITEDTAVKAINSGIHDCIMKNNIARLLPVVERELDDMHLRREQKLDREALLENELFLSNVFDSMFDGICVINNKMEIVRVNRVLEKWYSHRMPLIGKKCYDVFRDRLSRCEFCKCEEAIENQRATKELFPYISPEGGAPRWFETCIQPMLDSVTGEVAGIIKHIRDVTERVESEELKNRLAAIVEHSNDAIIGFDMNGIVTDWNRSAEKIFGLKSSDVCGYHVKNLFSEETIEEILEGVKEAKKGIFANNQRLDIKRKDGRIIHISFTTSPIKDINGTTVGISSVARDITEETIAKKESERNRLRLIQADKLTSLGTLVAGVAHEINNPIGYISMNSSFLADAWSDIMPILEERLGEEEAPLIAGLPYEHIKKDIPQVCSDVIEGTKRMKKIISDLKHFARENPSDKKEICEINEVIKMAVTLTKTSCRKSGVNFSAHYGSNLPHVLANSQRLEQVLINLIINGCHAVENTGKKLTVRSVFDENSGTVKIFVEDEGKGIPQDILPQIFDPFFTTKHDAGGTGLGLSISYGIIKDHGGSMDVSSEIGKGTVVTVSLPAAENKNDDGVVL